MDDRTLLELAAKAAGIEVIRSRLHDPLLNDMLVKHSARNPGQENGPWNPRDDDGDALRLAAKLGLDIRFAIGFGFVVAGSPIDGPEESITSDPCAATRRAVTRAAAAIGESK
jgi:hypothetical protein